MPSRSFADHLTVARAALLRADLARSGGLDPIAPMRVAAAHLEIAIREAEAGAEHGDLTAALATSIELAERHGPRGLLRIIEGGRR